MLFFFLNHLFFFFPVSLIFMHVAHLIPEYLQYVQTIQPYLLGIQTKLYKYSDFDFLFLTPYNE